MSFITRTAKADSKYCCSGRHFRVFGEQIESKD
jgi:hypothetical protein